MRAHANDLLGEVEIVLEIVLFLGVQHYRDMSVYVITVRSVVG